MLVIFEERLISGAPVVDERNHMQGDVSRTDITSHLLRTSNLLGTPVEEIMTPFVFRVRPEDGVEQLLGIIHRMIVTEGERPVGIVTTLDLLKDYGRLLTALSPPVGDPARIQK